MNNEALGEIVFLMLIAERKKKDALVAALLERGGHVVSSTYGKGTVKAGYIRNVLGLVPEENKIVISCLMSESKADVALIMLKEEFNFNKPNTGIAFTIPIDKLSF